LDDEDGDLLRRAAYLHEIGLAISHGGYHRHGAYLLQHSDVPGFSQVDQGRLSLLVGLHRRKLRDDAQAQVMRAGGPRLRDLCLLLRLAVLLHHGRSDQALPPLCLSVPTPNVWQVALLASVQDWPLLVADLQEEIVQFRHWGVTLDLHLQEEAV
jgi:exopolyphosphatase/guanosine-5'-triphosphate,3'-diphosphate pyrophosphatase